MSLKDEFEADINETFVNSDEFATIHEFDGVEIECIVDDDKCLENKIKDAKGTYIASKMIFVPLSQLRGKPIQGAIVTFDDKKYEVTECIDAEGILEISLSTTEDR